MTFARSNAHAAQAHDLIPGGAHTYAKGDDQYPAHMLPVIARGQGAHVWDLDGNRFVEFGSGMRAITLGHGYRPVCDAAFRAMMGGTNFARPGAIELHAAEAVLSVLPKPKDGDPWMIKFAKHGSDAASAAVKLARAVTGRSMVAICHDHPFFSVDDWFIGTTPMNAGIPDAIKNLTCTFGYNDINSLKALFERYPNQIACVMLEGVKDVEPKDNFLQEVRKVCDENCALMVLDEIINGFRLDPAGAAKVYDVEPDLSTWGKAMANGFAVSALIGKKRFMELGGIRQSKHDRVFLLSTTNGAETHALAACKATVDAYKQRDVCGTIRNIGLQLQRRCNAVSTELGMTDYWSVSGMPATLVFNCAGPDKKKGSQPFRTLFLQEMLKRGVICPSFVVSEAMTDRDVEHTAWAVFESLQVYKKALNGNLDDFLQSRPVAPVFRRRV
jgi:glutamate-1-semialdehyde 2,1-aminomutase